MKVLNETKSNTGGVGLQHVRRGQVVEETELRQLLQVLCPVLREGQGLTFDAGSGLGGRRDEQNEREEQKQNGNGRHVAVLVFFSFKRHGKASPRHHGAAGCEWGARKYFMKAIITEESLMLVLLALKTSRR